MSAALQFAVSLADRVLRTQPAAVRPPAVQRLSPLTRIKQHFVERFLAAAWPPDEVAHLFDLDPAAVAALSGARP